jgi:virginiamycin B lyase
MVSHAFLFSLRAHARYFLACAVAYCVIAAGSWSPSANADIYWANSGTANNFGAVKAIGRAGLDGTGVNQTFINTGPSPSAVTVDATHIYWTNFQAHTIGRANRDGTGVDHDFITGANWPFGLAVDGRHIYWSNLLSNTIGRANLDGSGVDQNFITGAYGPEELAINGTHIYWANYYAGTIGRANLDGSGVNRDFIAGATYPFGIAIDATHIYWTNSDTNTVGRASLDGTGVDHNFITGASQPYGLAVDAAHVYWVNYQLDSIARANIDGSDADQSFITGVSQPYGLDVAPDGPPCGAATCDATPPAVACDPPDADWHSDDVAIACTATDEDSGLGDPSDASFTLTTSVPDGTEDENASTDTRQVCDAVGNCATAGPITGIKVDRKAPAVSFSQSPNGSNGWFASAPAATHVDASDSQIATLACDLDGTDSGLQASSTPALLSGDVATGAEGRHTVDCTARDEAGNATQASDTLNLDATKPRPPSLSPERAPDYPASGGWFKDAITVAFSGQGDPDLADGSAGSGVDPTSVPAAEMRTTSGSHEFSGTVRDLAGHESDPGSATAQVDADPPTVSASCPIDPPLLGASATGAVTASDAHSGLSQDPTGNPALDTGPVGQRKLTATATDNVGHQATDACSYDVVFDWSGFLNPTANPPTLNGAKAGQTEKLTFRLGSYGALDILASGSPQSEPIDCTTGAQLGPADPVPSGSGALTYDPVANRYTYSWTTDPAWADTCRRFALGLSDGTFHFALLDFRAKAKAKKK